MSKLFHIAREEILFHLRQWTFYLTLLILPLAFAAIGAVPRLQAAAAETPLASVETVLTESEEITVPTGYVDHADLIANAPEPQTNKFRPFPSEAAATAALEQGQIESYYVIAADYVRSGKVVQYSPNPQLLAQTDGAVRKLLRQALLQSLNDPDRAARLARPVVLTRRGPPPPVASFIPAGLDPSRLISAGLVAGLFALVTSIGGNLLLRALHREVRARVLEMLVVSATPGQFVGGKLLGLAGLTLGQVAVTLLAGLLVYGQNPDGSGPAALPPLVLALSLPYLLLGFLAYCGLVMGIAAMWPTLRESGPLLILLRLLALSPLLGALFILPNANSPTSVGLTLLPLTAPLLMPFRLMLGPVPPWQWLLGILLLAAWAAFLIRLSMRLFRAHGLLTGRPLTLGTLRQALVG